MTPVDQILSTYGVITVVGASDNSCKVANRIPLYMQSQGWRIIPVNPRGGSILGEPTYATLADVPEQVGLVNVFRPSQTAAAVARQAAEVGASALWLQLGIVSDEARRIAEDAGMLFVQDRCILVEQRVRHSPAPAHD
jgi:predicted CoA-binding protein